MFTGRTGAETEAPVLWPPDVKQQLFEENPAKTEGKRRRGQQRMRWLDSIANSMDMNLSKLREIVKGREACRVAVHGVPKSWTTTTTLHKLIYIDLSLPEKDQMNICFLFWSIKVLTI